MTVTLHLGVEDFPYVGEPSAPRRVARARPGKQRPRRGKGDGAQSTGDVATILEAKYHVIETFYELHEQEIADAFADSVAGALESFIVGAPAGSLNPFGAAEDVTMTLFKQYLASEEIATTGMPGVPTQAALHGVSHRFKNRRGARRPSFIDTGLYEASFKAWTDAS